jgi:hypothetical protein
LSEKKDLYTMEFQELHRRDLRLIRAMGANAIRLWSWHEHASHHDFLDLCWNEGYSPLYVLLPFNPDWGSALTYKKNEDPSKTNSNSDEYVFFVSLVLLFVFPTVLLLLPLSPSAFLSDRFPRPFRWLM